MVGAKNTLKNSTTPRVFVAATRQNDGKTTTSLGLVAAIQESHPRVGFIKPIGQRFVDIHRQRIDEDTVLMDRVYGLNCPLDEMSPIAVEQDFTRRYLRTANYEALASRIQRAFDRVAWEKDIVLCEGTGHAGVGSVFDLSNARVAKLIGAKVIIVSRGGIGRPIDEIALNQALFEKENVEIIGVILNKVMPGKVDQVSEFARKGLHRRGLELLGVIPHVRLLSRPTMDLIREELAAEPMNRTDAFRNIVDDVVVGAMGAKHAAKLFRAGTLLIVPGDREDLIASVATVRMGCEPVKLSGVILTDDLRPTEAVVRVLQDLPYPVLFTREGSYEVASKVHDLIVKTRPDDTAKIALIRDLIRSHVDVKRILQSIT